MLPILAVSPSFTGFFIWLLSLALKDPISFSGADVDLYGYVANNPVNFIDPLGLWKIKLAFYWGYGGSITFGYHDNRIFIRYARITLADLYGCKVSYM